jgi:hypothetical protein
VKQKRIKWPDGVGVCMVAARMVAGYSGLQALIKVSAPEAMWTYCMMHHESLAAKQLCPELSQVMDTVVVRFDEMWDW